MRVESSAVNRAEPIIIDDDNILAEERLAKPVSTPTTAMESGRLSHCSSSRRQGIRILAGQTMMILRRVGSRLMSPIAWRISQGPSRRRGEFPHAREQIGYPPSEMEKDSPPAWAFISLREHGGTGA